MKQLVLGVALLWGISAAAETDQERQAREELERQLKSLVGTPPTKIKVEFEALFEGNFKLLEASFQLDGRTLPVVSLAELTKDGTHLIFFGDVAPGQHRLESRVAYQDASSFLVSTEAGYTWKLGSSVGFATQPGIEVDVTVTPVFDPKAADMKQKLKLTSPAKVVMLAQLDDGRMPEAMARPKLVAEVDAGVQVVEGEKKKTKAELAAEAAEAKKKAAEEALAAKKAAEEERRAKAEAARQERLAALEEKRRLAEEARLARATGGTVTPRPVETAIAPQPEVDAGPPAEVDAGAVAEVVDAGPPVAVVKPPPAPVQPPPEEGGIPLPVIIGVAVAVLGLVIFVVARRGKNNPQG